MSLTDRISADLTGLGDKPVVRGTQLPVGFVLGLLGAGESEKRILAKYPGLTHEDILACIEYGSNAVREFSPLASRE